MTWPGLRVPEDLTSERFRRSGWIWLFPVLSLLLTALAWQVTRVSTTARARNRFQFGTGVIESAIRQRLEAHESLLRGVAGLFAASDEVTRAEWGHYLRSVRPDLSTPGLQALGFSARVLPPERQRLERRLQQERLPFVVWPEGEREEYQAIVLIHPFDRINSRALGYDLATEPVRREAMARARDEGAAALSSHVRLVQDDARMPTQPGFLLYLPVYRVGVPVDTVTERRAALRGFVYGAFRVQDLMSSAFGGQRWDIDFEIFDGVEATDDRLLYRSAPGRRLMQETVGASLAHGGALEAAGQRWLLLAMPSPGFVSPTESNQHWLVAGGGLAINLLFWFGLWASGAMRRRALVIAEGMAQAVRVSEAQSRLMVDSITDHAIFRLDATRNVASWNSGAERMLGYTEAEALGQPASRLWVGAESNPYLDAGRAPRLTREGWHSRKDGERFWGVAAVAKLQQGDGGSTGFVVILRDDSSRRESMEALAEATAELEQRTVELGRFNRLASGRELRMIELKRMVNDRSIQLGMQPPFDLSFVDEFTDVRPSSGDAF